jgi:hypothetical protein
MTDSTPERELAEMRARIEDEAELLLGAAEEATSAVDELVFELDDHVAEAHWSAVDEALQGLADHGQAAGWAVPALAVLRRLQGTECDARRVDQPQPLPVFRLPAIDDDDGDEEVRAALAGDLVSDTGRHLHALASSARDSLESAVHAADGGCDAEALSHLGHFRTAVWRCRRAFEQWTRSLHAFYELTGAFPGVAGIQVGATEEWLKDHAIDRELEDMLREPGDD